MEARTREVATRWARQFNRRRLIEEALRGLGWSLVAGSGAVLAWQWTGSAELGVGLGAAAAAVVGAMVWRRTRRRSLSPAGMARCVDRHMKLGDVLSTALAIEAGEASGDAGLGELVVQRAWQVAERLDVRPIGPVRWPWRSTLAGCAAVALAALLHLVAAGVTALPDAARAEASEAPAAPGVSPQRKNDVPALPEQTREELRRDAEALERLMQTPGLSEETRRGLEAVSGDLRTASDEGAAGRRALSALSSAESGLRELQRKAARGEHLDPEGLRKLSEEELAERLREALERGDQAMAEALTRELERRVAAGTGADKERGQALRQIAERGQPQSGSGSRATVGQMGEGSRMERGERRPGREGAGEQGAQGAEEGNDPRSRLRRAAEHLERGNRAAANHELEQMLKQLRRRSRQEGGEGQQGSPGAAQPQRAFDQQMAELLRRASEAKQQQLAGMRGEGTQNPCDQLAADPRDEQAKARCERMMQAMGVRPCEDGDDHPLCKAQREGQMAMGAPTPGMGQMPMPGMGQMPMPGMGQMPGGQMPMPGSGLMPGESAGITRLGGNDPSRGGKPSPTPGGGAGAEDGNGRLTPDDVAPGAEWIQSAWSDSPQGVVRIIQRGAQGERSSVEYENVHGSYAEIAESATEREAIPLTRRDYIQRYFERIRPTSER